MESILYAQFPDDIVVVRVQGKGNHLNVSALREVERRTSEPGRKPRYVFDLERCETMDSTFMGILASLAEIQAERTGTMADVVNMNDHVRGLLNTLGLKFVLKMHAGHGPDAAAACPTEALEKVEPPPLDKVERIVMMIEAHEKLVDVDSGNEVKFKGVLQNLRESLDRTKGTGGG